MPGSTTVGILRVLLTADKSEFDAAMKAASGSAKAWSKDLGAIGQQATAVGRTLTAGLTLPLVGLAAGASKLAISFESSFAGVKKTVNATEAEFATLAQGFRDLAKTIPINVNELNKIGEAAGALGIRKADILDFTETMALLGVTTNLTSDQAATSIAQIQNIFNAAGKDTKNFASALVALGNDGASTEAQIVEFASRLAGAGNQIGLSQQAVLGFGAALANMGLNAELGGTALSKVMSKMSVAVDTGGKKLDEFARIAGMTSTAFASLFKQDAAEAILQYVEGLGRAGKAGENLTITLNDVGLKGSNVQDVLKRLAGGGDQMRTALDLSNKAWRENSALTEEARKRFETTEAKLTLLWNRIKDVGISLGNALLPTINAAIGSLDRLIPLIDSAAKWFSGLPAPIQNTAIGLLAVVAAVGPVTYAFGILATNVSTLIGLFKAKGLATRLLTGDFGTLGKVSLSLGGILGTGLTAVVLAAGVALNELQKATTDSWKAMADGKGTWEDVPNVLGNAISRGLWPFGQAWRDITQGIKDAKNAWDIFRSGGTLELPMPGGVSQAKGDIDISGPMGSLLPKILAVTDATKDLSRIEEQLAKGLGATNDATNDNAEANTKAAAATEKANAAADALNATNDKLIDTMRAAGIMTQQVVATGLAPLIEQLNLAAAESLKVDDGGQQLRLTLIKVEPAILEMAEAMRVAGKDTSWLIDWLNQLKQTAGSLPAVLQPSFQNLGNIVKNTFGDSTELVRSSLESLPKIATTNIGAVGDAYKTLGVTSTRELQQQAREAERAYLTIKNSGVASADDIQAAYLKMVEAVNAASGRLPSFWETNILPRFKDIFGRLGQGLFDTLLGMRSQSAVEHKRLADDAIANYERIKADGTKTPEDIRQAFVAMQAAIEKASRPFRDTIVDVFKDMGRGIKDVFSDILNDFTGRLLKGMLGALTGQQGAWSKAFSGLLNVAGIAGVGGAAALANTAGVGSATWMAAAGMPAGAAGAGAGGGAAAGGAGISAGLAAGAASVGAGVIMGMIGKKIFGGAGWKASGFGAATGAATGALIGSVVPVLGTAVGAIIGGLAGAISGWIGKSGAMKVNDARDQVLSQFGPSGTDAGSGYATLAAKLQEATGSNALFEKFAKASTMKEFAAATKEAEIALIAYEKKTGAATAANAKLAEQMQSVRAAMKPDELKALADGFQQAVSEGFTGTIDEFLKQQLIFYSTLKEGDARLKTFFSGETIDAFNRMAAASNDATLKVIADANKRVEVLTGEMKTLDDELAKIDKSEAPEKNMGTVEKNARKRIADQKQIVQNALDAQKQATEKMLAELAKAAADSGAEAGRGIDEGFKEGFLKVPPQVDAARTYMDDTFKDLRYSIPINFNMGELPQIPNVPAMALGGFVEASRPTLVMMGEAGREQAVFSGANKTFGGGGGSQTVNVTFAISALDGSDVLRVVRSEDFRRSFEKVVTSNEGQFGSKVSAGIQKYGVR